MWGTGWGASDIILGPPADTCRSTTAASAISTQVLVVLRLRPDRLCEGGCPLPGGRQCGVALYACLPYYNNGSTCVRSSRYLLGQGMTAAGREGAWPRPCAVALYAYWPLYNAGSRYLLDQRTCNAAPVARRLGCVTYHLLRSRRRYLRVGMSPALVASTGGGAKGRRIG